MKLTEQLSLHTTTIEPVLQSLEAPTTEPTGLQLMLPNNRSRCSEKPAHYNREQPPLRQTQTVKNK